MIFVTGANGFVGSSLCEELTRRDIPFLAGNRSLYMDLGRQRHWGAFLQDIEVVVHLAARVHIMNDASKDPLADFRQTNVKATVNLAQAAKEAGVKKFIFLSSIKVNGEETFETPFRGNDATNASDPYGISKQEAELELLKLNQVGKFEVVIIRPPLIYGPKVKANFEQLFKLVSLGLPLPFALVNNKRSFVSLKNLNDLIIHCFFHPKAVGKVFLVSDDKDLSFQELLKLMAKTLGKRVILFPFPVLLLKIFFIIIGKADYNSRLFGNLQVDIEETKDLLDWKPRFTFEDSFN